MKKSTSPICALTSIVAAVIAALATGTVHADEDRHRMAMHVRVDNDVFASSDRGYTNGLQFGFTSQTVDTFDSPALPRRLRDLNRRLTWLQPRGFPDNNVTLTIAHGIMGAVESIPAAA